MIRHSPLFQRSDDIETYVLSPSTNRPGPDASQATQARQEPCSPCPSHLHQCLRPTIQHSPATSCQAATGRPGVVWRRQTVGDRSGNSFDAILACLGFEASGTSPGALPRFPQPKRAVPPSSRAGGHVRIDLRRAFPSCWNRACGSHTPPRSPSGHRARRAPG